ARARAAPTRLPRENADARPRPPRTAPRRRSPPPDRNGLGGRDQPAEALRGVLSLGTMAARLFVSAHRDPPRPTHAPGQHILQRRSLTPEYRRIPPRLVAPPTESPAHSRGAFFTDYWVVHAPRAPHPAPLFNDRVLPVVVAQQMLGEVLEHEMVR